MLYSLLQVIIRLMTMDQESQKRPRCLAGTPVRQKPLSQWRMRYRTLSQNLPKVSMSTNITVTVWEECSQSCFLRLVSFTLYWSGSQVCFQYLRVHGSLLISTGDVWLKWWSEKNTTRMSPSTPYYLGIYAGLEVGAFGVFVVWVMLVAICTLCGSSSNRL